MKDTTDLPKEAATNDEAVIWIDNVTGAEYESSENCVNGCHQFRGDAEIKRARKEAERTREAYAAKQKKAPVATKAATKGEDK